jgi:hypothetical protein
MDTGSTSRHPPGTQALAAVAGVRPALAGRAAELLGLFAVLPFLVRWRVVAAPRLLVLGLVTAGCIAVLLRDPSFDRRVLFSLGRLRGSLRAIGARALVAAAVIVGLVLLLRPEALLAVPRRSPGLWLAGLAIYPFLSAWPQEVVYRVFFVHRYGRLFGSEAGLLGANAVAFALLHAVYPNPVAPLLSLPAGLLLARTYRRTGTMGPVWLEHSLYGLLLFTLGLGGFFYDGRP